MTLFPLQAYERNPMGLIPLKPALAVEGGMVGEIQPSTVATLPEVDLFADSGSGTYQLSLVGLIDDSSTGTGYGVSGVGTPIAPGITPDTGTPSGPATHLASRKCTLWTDSGFFVTDVWDTANVTLGAALATTPVGTQLYAGTAGTTGLLTATGSDVLGRFVRRFIGGQGPVDDFDSWFIPRVQPLPAGRTFLVLKFK